MMMTASTLNYLYTSNIYISKQTNDMQLSIYSGGKQLCNIIYFAYLKFTVINTS